MMSHDVKLQQQQQKQQHQHQNQYQGKEKVEGNSDYKGSLATDHRHHEATSSRTLRRGSDGLQGCIGLLAGLVILIFVLLMSEFMREEEEDEATWDKKYKYAVVQDETNWEMGWRLATLEKQAANQRSKLEALSKVLDEISQASGSSFLARSLRKSVRREAPAAGATQDAGAGNEERDVKEALILAKVLAKGEDMNQLVSIECASRPDKYLQVGMHGMVASADDGCKVYSAAPKPLGPHSIFEKIELEGERVAFRAFSNGRFLRVRPQGDNEDIYTWVVEVGESELGVQETFTIRGDLVYSEAMKGYLSCSGRGLEAEVKGVVGEYIWGNREIFQFVINPVSGKIVERARTLRELSELIHSAQRQEAEVYLASQASGQEHGSGRKGRSRGGSSPTPDAVTIAMCVPMTSRGTVIESTSGSPFWDHSFQTFLTMTDWNTTAFRFHWYLGFDVGDPIYDTSGAWEELATDFRRLALQEFDRQGVTPENVEGILSDVLRLTPMHFEGLEHAPSKVVSKLMDQAFRDGCDYFYQINDDSFITTSKWAETFTEILRNNPLGENVGVTGPTDTNNPRILTHAFVHRTHIEIFGRFFPESFKNWWSDDWISNVYGPDHTLRNHSMTVKHDVVAQKTSANNRYMIDELAKDSLMGELKTGYVKVSKWLTSNGMPGLVVPSVCGYAPLVEDVVDLLQKRWRLEHPPPPSATLPPRELQIDSFDLRKRTDDHTEWSLDKDDLDAVEQVVGSPRPSGPSPFEHPDSDRAAVEVGLPGSEDGEPDGQGASFKTGAPSQVKRSAVDVSRNREEGEAEVDGGVSAPHDAITGDSDSWSEGGEGAGDVDVGGEDVPGRPRGGRRAGESLEVGVGGGEELDANMTDARREGGVEAKLETKQKKQFIKREGMNRTAGGDRGREDGGTGLVEDAGTEQAAPQESQEQSVKSGLSAGGDNAYQQPSGEGSPGDTAITSGGKQEEGEVERKVGFGEVEPEHRSRGNVSGSLETGDGEGSQGVGERDPEMMAQNPEKVLERDPDEIVDVSEVIDGGDMTGGENGREEKTSADKSNEFRENGDGDSPGTEVTKEDPLDVVGRGEEIETAGGKGRQATRDGGESDGVREDEGRQSSSEEGKGSREGEVRERRAPREQRGVGKRREESSGEESGSKTSGSSRVADEETELANDGGFMQGDHLNVRDHGIKGDTDFSVSDKEGSKERARGVLEEKEADDDDDDDDDGDDDDDDDGDGDGDEGELEVSREAGEVIGAELSERDAAPEERVGDGGTGIPDSDPVTESETDPEAGPEGDPRAKGHHSLGQVQGNGADLSVPEASSLAEGRLEKEGRGDGRGEVAEGEGGVQDFEASKADVQDFEVLEGGAIDPRQETREEKDSINGTEQWGRGEDTGRGVKEAKGDGGEAEDEESIFDLEVDREHGRDGVDGHVRYERGVEEKGDEEEGEEEEGEEEEGEEEEGEAEGLEEEGLEEEGLEEEGLEEEGLEEEGLEEEGLEEEGLEEEGLEEEGEGEEGEEEEGEEEEGEEEEGEEEEGEEEEGEDGGGGKEQWEPGVGVQDFKASERDPTDLLLEKREETGLADEEARDGGGGAEDEGFFFDVQVMVEGEHGRDGIAVEEDGERGDHAAESGLDGSGGNEDAEEMHFRVDARDKNGVSRQEDAAAAGDVERKRGWKHEEGESAEGNRAESSGGTEMRVRGRVRQRT